MRTPKNIDTADLRSGILCTRGEVVKRIEYLNAQIDYNHLNGQPHCKENRQMRREIRQLSRYRRRLSRMLRDSRR